MIHGDAGDDVIFGGANDDNLFGDDGIDQLYGQEGNDMLRAGAGINVGAGGNPRFDRNNATDILLIEGSLLPDVITLLEQDVGITSKNDLAPALIANGRPSAAPVFTLTLNGQSLGPITVANTATNNSLDDLPVYIC